MHFAREESLTGSSEGSLGVVTRRLTGHIFYVFLCGFKGHQSRYISQSVMDKYAIAMEIWCTLSMPAHLPLWLELSFPRIISLVQVQILVLRYGRL